MNKIVKKKAWFVEFPTHQYVEDVKQLAKENGLLVVDAVFSQSKAYESVKGPTLTKKADVKEDKAK